ncbi:MAG: glycosyltransferase, partial [Fuerstiella sp.]|nr:glycosyltransferase [Fuerstiella sp.]
MSDAGVDTRLMALQPEPTEPIYNQTEFFPTGKLPFAYRLGVSNDMRRALHAAAKESDVIHTHSLWMMPNVYPEKAARGTSCAVVVSPRGTISRWALRRSRVRKWCVWRMGQKRLLDAANCIHATCHDELQDVRSLGLRNPVALVPNGVSCPVLPETPIHDQRSNRTVLFLARIHPKKGVDTLLRAWRAIESQFTDWNLKIAGPLGSDYSAQMIQLSSELQLKRVNFVGEVTGPEKAQTFFDSDLYVLPTHSENFGISVA